MIGGFSCPILACGQVNFSTLSEVYKHLEKAHFKCPFQDCEDQFLNLNDVDIHLKMDHQQERPEAQEIQENAKEKTFYNNNTFPTEILEMVFGNLSSLKDVYKCRNTCTRWTAVIDKIYKDKGKHIDFRMSTKFLNLNPRW